MTTRFMLACGALTALAAPTFADQFRLLTGVDAGLYPGTTRVVPISPGPGFPGEFADGDRLAGTADVGGAVSFVGVNGPPFFDPNEFGALSFLYRRGSAPTGLPSFPQVPFMGIEFLGGPLLDLDGDLLNGVRSLTPTAGVTPAIIPDSASYFELEVVSTGAGRELELLAFDATGTNEGAPGTGPDVATILVTLAGTAADGTPGDAINPAVDTRVTTASAYTGTSGTLAGVFRVENLGYELWEDTILASPSTGPFLGTLQFLGTFEGWLIERDGSGAWPALAGEGLGTTLWPLVNASTVGQQFTAAHGATPATIAAGVGVDDFTTPVNGGVALSDFGGDLGAYLDGVVLPLAAADEDRVIFLQSAGYGLNNSFDPVFQDTVGYDAVIIAAGRSDDPCAGAVACDANCDGATTVSDIAFFVAAVTGGEAGWNAAFPSGEAPCPFLCVNDTSGDGAVTVSDIAPFVQCLIQ